MITARKTMSIIFGASEESVVRWLILISSSEINGMTIIRSADMKYTRLFAKISFMFIPAKSIPVTIILAGPIMLPTLESVSVRNLRQTDFSKK